MQTKSLESSQVCRNILALGVCFKKSQTRLQAKSDESIVGESGFYVLNANLDILVLKSVEIESYMSVILSIVISQLKSYSPSKRTMWDRLSFFILPMQMVMCGTQ